MSLSCNMMNEAATYCSIAGTITHHAYGYYTVKTRYNLG